MARSGALKTVWKVQMFTNSNQSWSSSSNTIFHHTRTPLAFHRTVVGPLPAWSRVLKSHFPPVTTPRMKTSWIRLEAKETEESLLWSGFSNIWHVLNSRVVQSAPAGRWSHYTRLTCYSKGNKAQIFLRHQAAWVTRDRQAPRTECSTLVRLRSVRAPSAGSPEHICCRAVWQHTEQTSPRNILLTNPGRRRWTNLSVRMSSWLWGAGRE